MTTTVEYLDALKTKLGAVSDYDLGKKMNVTRATISSYRTGRSNFDDDMCQKVASMLEIPLHEVVLNIYAERSSNVAIKSSFRELLKHVGSVAATLLIASGLNIATPSPANAGAGSTLSEGSPNDVYYVKLKVCGNQRFKPEL
jgi:transcriptional regulator with XRE-family HTH domain